MLDDVERRRYCLIIFAGCTVSPLHIARCGAHSDRRSQATIRSPLLNPHPGRLFVRRHVRKPTIEPDCLSASGQVQIRQSQSSRCHGGTLVRSRCVGRSAQRAHHREQQRHRRSEWAGVSWPKDDRDERGAADGTGLARRQGTPDVPRTPQALHFARSSVPWRGRLRVSALNWR